MSKQPKDAIHIILYSAWDYSTTKDEYEERKKKKNLDSFQNNDNILLVTAWTDIRTNADGKLRNELLHEDCNPNDHAYYSAPQSQASKDNNVIISIWTNSIWNANLHKDNWDYKTSWSCYPNKMFDEECLFAWRIIPVHARNWSVFFSDWLYTASYPNAVNTGTISQCFLMKPDLKNVQELKTLVINSSNTDYIEKDWEKQKLSLPSPAWFFKKYCMPTTQSLPVKQGETKSLEKGSYKGIVFNIPGAEVNINGQWIAFDDKNRDAIIAQNPFSMKWRISGVLLRKLGYK